LTAALRKGFKERFTINRLGLPGKLRRCLGATNIIDDGRSALRDRVRRVKHWRSGTMASRGTAAAFDAISAEFRRILGHADLWFLKATLDENAEDRPLADRVKAG
jgi:hypothetical protein